MLLKSGLVSNATSNDPPVPFGKHHPQVNIGNRSEKFVQIGRLVHQHQTRPSALFG